MVFVIIAVVVELTLFFAVPVSRFINLEMVEYKYVGSTIIRKNKSPLLPLLLLLCTCHISFTWLNMQIQIM